MSIVLNACGRAPDELVKETGSTESVIPADYATAIVVTINPQIKLYLDSDNAIIGAEFLNEDARNAYGKSHVYACTTCGGGTRAVTCASCGGDGKCDECDGSGHE